MTPRLPLALWLLITAPAAALDQEDLLSAALLPGYAIEGGQMAGLSLVLHPGWKTYWRAPGDAGIPPVFDWSGSTNLKSVTVHWPTPSVFETNGMQTIGYHDQVTFPLELTASDPARPIHLKARVTLGICKDICMPAELTLEAELGVETGQVAQIRSALRERPGQQGSARCRLSPIRDGFAVEAEIDLPPLGRDEVVAIESGDDRIWVSSALARRQGGRLFAAADLLAPGQDLAGLDRSALTLTILAEGRGVEIRGCPAP